MEFVFDRTAEDVEKALQWKNRRYENFSESEKAQWNEGLKGTINASDWNRIEGNISAIAEEIVVSVSSRSWTRLDIPRHSDYVRLLNNLAKIRAGYGIMSDTPQVPTQPINTFQKWNDIEKILYGAHYVYTHSTEDVYYCDTELYAGEGVGII